MSFRAHSFLGKNSMQLLHILRRKRRTYLEKQFLDHFHSLVAQYLRKQRIFLSEKCAHKFMKMNLGTYIYENNQQLQPCKAKAFA